MKLIIAGSRTISLDCSTIRGILDVFGLKPIEIVSGGAEGIDKSGEKVYHYKKSNGTNYLPISKIKRFKADWGTHGKAAGPIRNKQMAEYSDVLLLIWDGESRGSANMKANMQMYCKPIYEVILKKSTEIK